MGKIPARFSKTGSKTEISLTRLEPSHMNTLNDYQNLFKATVVRQARSYDGLCEETLNAVHVYVKLTSLVIFVSSTNVNKPFYTLLGLSRYSGLLHQNTPPPPLSPLHGTKR